MSDSKKITFKPSQLLYSIDHLCPQSVSVPGLETASSRKKRHESDSRVPIVDDDKQKSQIRRRAGDKVVRLSRTQKQNKLERLSLKNTFILALCFEVRSESNWVENINIAVLCSNVGPRQTCWECLRGSNGLAYFVKRSMTAQKKKFCSKEQKDWHRMTNNTFKTYDFLGRLKPGEKKFCQSYL